MRAKYGDDWELLLADVDAEEADAGFWEAAVRDGQAASVRLLRALSAAVRARVLNVPLDPITLARTDQRTNNGVRIT